MKKLLIAASLALMLPVLAACAGSSAPQTAQDKVDTLDLSWTLAKATATAYVATCRLQPQASICTPAVVDQVSKAIEVADVAIVEARRSILAAGSDRSALQKAVAYGLSAIALFQQTLLTYGVSTG